MKPSVKNALDNAAAMAESQDAEGVFVIVLLPNHEVAHFHSGLSSFLLVALLADALGISYADRAAERKQFQLGAVNEPRNGGVN